MPLLNTSIPNLAQGVSQQPDNLRYPGQCDEQINAWSTVVEGLVKRPNSRFLNQVNAQLGTNLTAEIFTHYVDRDNDNRYVITYDRGNGLKAFDLEDGGPMTINVEDATAQAYLSVSSGDFNPVKDLRALTIADSTFLVNKKKTVAKDSTFKSKDLEKEALIFVKLGDYEKTYDVFLDGQLVGNTGGLQSNKVPPAGHTYESGSNSSGEHADTEIIAEDLQTCINAFVGSAGTVESITFSGTGASGFTPTGGNFRRKVSYTYTVSQTVGGGAIATGAGGTLVFNSSGQVSSSTLTFKGTGYDSDTTTFPLSVSINKITKITVDKGIRSISGRYSTTYETQIITSASLGFTLPTISSSSVSGSTTKFTTERQGSVIKIIADSDFQIKVADGLSDQALGVIYKEVDSITDLPKSCFDLFRVKIMGDADLDQDDYYVKFKTKDNEDFGQGSWIEDAGWTNEGTDKSESLGLETFLDQDTMPVRLVPTPSTGKITGFTLKLIDWTPRGAGDDNTNPFPSFTGSTINDIFFFKNRLGVLTDDAVVFSEADEYFNFFRTTTQSLLDSAPIDVGVSHTKISILKHAQAFQEKLMLFSPKTQFVLRGGDLLTPKTVTISPVTEFDVSETIRPLALSSYIYFNFKRNNFEGLLEYTVDNNTETYRAAEITEQINKYIPTNIVRMEGSAAENMVVVQSDSDYKKLYVYKYFWQGNEKIQSSWMTFSFAKDIRSFYFIESTLYVITTDSIGTYIETIPMENGLVESDKNYALLLDHRLPGSSTFLTFLGWHVSSPVNINGQNISNATEIGTQSGFKFQTGMSLYTKNGNKRELIIDNTDDTRAVVKGLIADFVSYGGSLVYNGDIKYICTDTHTSDAAKKPGEGADWQNFWRVITTTQAANAWSSGQSYTEEVLYVCTRGHVSTDANKPPSSPEWGLAGSFAASAPLWNEGYEYLDSDDFFIGFEYDMLYRFSKQNLKQPTERGGRSASDYTFQTIRNGSIEYADTGHFTVEVTPKFRDKYTYTYNPSLLASVSTLSKFTPETGFFKFAVQAQPNDATIEIKSSSALPVKLLAAEFESTIISRSRRYGG
tara:strand:- start:266 stop:3499 length:3234 start_codon:yes stop_codon:yes gene_type:complete